MLNLMCLDMNLLELLYLEFAEILGLMFFITVGRLWLLSSQLFCTALSLPSLPPVLVLVFRAVPLRAPRCCSFFFILFISLHHPISSQLA